MSPAPGAHVRSIQNLFGGNGVGEARANKIADFLYNQGITADPAQAIRHNPSLLDSFDWGPGRSVNWASAKQRIVDEPFNQLDKAFRADQTITQHEYDDWNKYDRTDPMYRQQAYNRAEELGRAPTYWQAQTQKSNARLSELQNAFNTIVNPFIQTHQDSGLKFGDYEWHGNTPYIKLEGKDWTTRVNFVGGELFINNLQATPRIGSLNSEGRIGPLQRDTATLFESLFAPDKSGVVHDPTRRKGFFASKSDNDEPFAWFNMNESMSAAAMTLVRGRAQLDDASIHYDPHYSGKAIDLRTFKGGTGNDLFDNWLKGLKKQGLNYYAGPDIMGEDWHKQYQGTYLTPVDQGLAVMGNWADAEGNIHGAANAEGKQWKRFRQQRGGGMVTDDEGTPRNWMRGLIGNALTGEPLEGFRMRTAIGIAGGSDIEGLAEVRSGIQFWHMQDRRFELPTDANGKAILTDEQRTWLNQMQGQRLGRGDVMPGGFDLVGKGSQAAYRSWNIVEGRSETGSDDPGYKAWLQIGDLAVTGLPTNVKSGTGIKALAVEAGRLEAISKAYANVDMITQNPGDWNATWGNIVSAMTPSEWSQNLKAYQKFSGQAAPDNLTGRNPRFGVDTAQYLKGMRNWYINENTRDVTETRMMSSAFLEMFDQRNMNDAQTLALGKELFGEGAANMSADQIRAAIPSFMGERKQVGKDLWQVAVQAKRLFTNLLVNPTPEHPGYDVSVGEAQAYSMGLLPEYGDEISNRIMQMGDQGRQRAARVSWAAMANAGGAAPNSMHIRDLVNQEGASNFLQGMLDFQGDDFGRAQHAMEGLQGLFGGNGTLRVGDSAGGIKYLPAPEDVMGMMTASGSGERQVNPFINRYIEGMSGILGSISAGDDIDPKALNRMLTDKTKGDSARSLQEVVETAGFQKDLLSPHVEGARNQLAMGSRYLGVGDVGYHMDDLVEMIAGARRNANEDNVNEGAIRKELEKRSRQDPHTPLDLMAIFRFPNNNPAFQNVANLGNAFSDVQMRLGGAQEGDIPRRGYVALSLQQQQAMEGDFDADRATSASLGLARGGIGNAVNPDAIRQQAMFSTEQAKQMAVWMGQKGIKNGKFDIDTFIGNIKDTPFSREALGAGHTAVAAERGRAMGSVYNQAGRAGAIAYARWASAAGDNNPNAERVKAAWSEGFSKRYRGPLDEVINPDTKGTRSLGEVMAQRLAGTNLVTGFNRYDRVLGAKDVDRREHFQQAGKMAIAANLLMTDVPEENRIGALLPSNASRGLTDEIGRLSGRAFREMGREGADKPAVAQRYASLIDQAIADPDAGTGQHFYDTDALATAPIAQAAYKAVTKRKFFESVTGSDFWNNKLAGLAEFGAVMKHYTATEGQNGGYGQKIKSLIASANILSGIDLPGMGGRALRGIMGALGGRKPQSAAQESIGPVERDLSQNQNASAGGAAGGGRPPNNYDTSYDVPGPDDDPDGFQDAYSQHPRTQAEAAGIDPNGPYAQEWQNYTDGGPSVVGRGGGVLNGAGIIPLGRSDFLRAAGYMRKITGDAALIRGLTPGGPMNREQAEATIRLSKNLIAFNSIQKRAGATGGRWANNITREFGEKSQAYQQAAIPSLTQRVLGFDEQDNYDPESGLIGSAEGVISSDKAKSRAEREQAKVERTENRLFGNDPNGAKAVGQVGGLRDSLAELVDIMGKAQTSTRGLTKAQADHVEAVANMYKQLTGKVSGAEGISDKSPEAAQFLEKFGGAEGQDTLSRVGRILTRGGQNGEGSLLDMLGEQRATGQYNLKDMSASDKLGLFFQGGRAGADARKAAFEGGAFGDSLPEQLAWRGVGAIAAAPRFMIQNRYQLRGIQQEFVGPMLGARQTYLNYEQMGDQDAANYASLGGGAALSSEAAIAHRMPGALQQFRQLAFGRASNRIIGGLQDAFEGVMGNDTLAEANAIGNTMMTGGSIGFMLGGPTGSMLGSAAGLAAGGLGAVLGTAGNAAARTSVMARSMGNVLGRQGGGSMGLAISPFEAIGAGWGVITGQYTQKDMAQASNLALLRNMPSGSMTSHLEELGMNTPDFAQKWISQELDNKGGELWGVARDLGADEQRKLANLGWSQTRGIKDVSQYGGSSTAMQMTRLAPMVRATGGVDKFIATMAHGGMFTGDLAMTPESPGFGGVASKLGTALLDPRFNAMWQSQAPAYAQLYESQMMAGQQPIGLDAVLGNISALAQSRGNPEGARRILAQRQQDQTWASGSGQAPMFAKSGGAYYDYLSSVQDNASLFNAANNFTGAAGDIQNTLMTGFGWNEDMASQAGGIVQAAAPYASQRSKLSAVNMMMWSGTGIGGRVSANYTSQATAGVDPTQAIGAIAAGRNVREGSAEWNKIVQFQMDAYDSFKGNLPGYRAWATDQAAQAQYSSIMRMGGGDTSTEGAAIALAGLNPVQQGLISQTAQGMSGYRNVTGINPYGGTYKRYEQMVRGATTDEQIFNAGRVGSQLDWATNYNAAAAAYGGATQGNLDILQANAMQMTGPQFAAYQRQIQGDPIALSQMVAGRGMTAANQRFYQVQDARYGGTAGMQAMYDETLQPAQRSALQASNVKFGGVGSRYAAVAGMNYSAVSGMNEVDTQGRMANIEFEQGEYEWQMQQRGRTRQRAITTGANLAGQRASILASGGGEYADLAIASGGQWALEDKNRALSWAQQDFGRAQAGQQLGIQQAQFAMSGAQWQENFNLRQNRTLTQQAWQGQDMGIQQSHARQEGAWGLENLAYQRNMSELSFGFNMIDSQESIRYSTGRQRRVAMRHQEEAVITHSMQMGQQDREEERAKQRLQWQDEQFAKDRTRFEQNKQWTQEDMNLDKKYHDQSRELEAQNMALSVQRYQMEGQFIQQNRDLDMQSRALSRANTLMEMTDQQNLANQVRQTNAELAVLKQHLQDIANVRMTNTTTTQYQVVTQQIVQQVSQPTVQQAPVSTGGGAGMTYPQIQSSLGNLQSSLPLTGITATAPSRGGAFWGGGFVGGLRSFAPGGYTGMGGKYEPMGVVHGGEYVVPQEGAPVVRGDNRETVAKLSEISAWLKRVFDQLVKMESGGNAIVQINQVDPSAAMRQASNLYQKAWSN